jgi:hypothetical protein
VVVPLDRPCPQTGQVRAGARFGEALTPDLVGVLDGWQVTLLLSVGAPVHEGGADQVEAHAARQHRGPRRRVLLVPDDPLDQPGAAPAVLLGPRDADPAGRVHRLLPRAPALEGLAIGRHPVVGRVVEAEVGGQVGLEPAAEFLAERLLLGGVLKVHGTGT